jgi:RNA polymerase-interacting CarD/CdnL/TRCF family regulator
MLAGFDPGANVLHPAFGVCRVVGVKHVAAAGESFDALAIARTGLDTGVIQIPLSKLASVGLRVLTAAEALEEGTRGGPRRNRGNSFLFARAGRAKGRAKSAGFAA